MAKSTVKIQVLGSSEALRELGGVRRGANEAAIAEVKAAKAAEKAASKAAAEHEKAAKKAADVARRASEATTKKQKQEADKQRKEAEKLAEHWARLAQKSADARMRAEERVTKAAQREAAKQARIAERTRRTREADSRRTLMRAGGVLGALGAGALAAGGSAMGTARSITGVDDAATRVQKANDFRERLILVSGQAGLDDRGTARVQSQIQSAAMASGKGPDELVGVLEAGQAKFNDLRFFADNLAEISKMAKASGSDTTEFAQALGYIRQAFGLTEKEAIDAGYKMIQAANKGSIEVKDFARDFASVAGVFAQSTGQMGMEGVNEFLGTAQSAGTLGAGSAETATMVERLVAFMGNPTHQKEIKERTGIKVGGKSMSEIVALLADSRKFNKEGVRSEIFGGDIIPNKAIMALIASYRRVQEGKEGAIDIGSIAAEESAGGREFTNTMMGRMESSGLLDMQRQAIEMQNDTIEHLEDYNAQILAVTKVSNQLEKAFGTLALWAGAIGVGGAVTGGIGLAAKLAGGSAAAAGAAGAGAAGAVAGGGMLATAGLVAGGTALVGAAGAAGAAAGYGLNAWSESQTGKTISDHIVDLFFDEVQRRSTQGMGGGKAQAPVEGELEVKITLDENRTTVKTLSKARGARISTAAGVNMPKAL
jgi:hypothetical protein